MIGLTVPVSSSSVTNIVPLAVPGRWRCVTRPLARASRPFGQVLSTGAGCTLKRESSARSSVSWCRLSVSQAATCRPLSNSLALPIIATSAVEVVSPTPINCINR